MHTMKYYSALKGLRLKKALKRLILIVLESDWLISLFKCSILEATIKQNKGQFP